MSRAEGGSRAGWDGRGGGGVGGVVGGGGGEGGLGVLGGGVGCGGGVICGVKRLLRKGVLMGERREEGRKEGGEEVERRGCCFAAVVS